MVIVRLISAPRHTTAAQPTIAAILRYLPRPRNHATTREILACHAHRQQHDGRADRRPCGGLYRFVAVHHHPERDFSDLGGGQHALAARPLSVRSLPLYPL